MIYRQQHIFICVHVHLTARLAFVHTHTQDAADDETFFSSSVKKGRKNQKYNTLGGDASLAHESLTIKTFGKIILNYLTTK